MKRLNPILVGCVFLFLFPENHAEAQTPATPFDLYVQTSEVAGLILQYGQDIQTPITKRNGSSTILNKKW